jgi:hypothetical protein
MRVACYFNNSIEVIYRCDLSTNKWNYIHGSTERFRTCSPPCDNNERNNLLDKYFTQSQQTKIRTIYIRKKKLLRLRCFNTNENLWKSINYQCGKMSITKYQWFKLHSCFQPTITTTTVLPRKNFFIKLLSEFLMDCVFSCDGSNACNSISTCLSSNYYSW